MLFSLCAPITYGIGAALGALLVVTALVLRVRGYRWIRPLVVGVTAIGLTALTTLAWQTLIVGTAEVENAAERARHADAEDSFKDAFDRASAPPPERGSGVTRRGGDAGTDFGDDAQTKSARDGGPGRSE